MSLESDDIFIATVSTVPDAPSALVCLAGEIDMTASAALTEVIEALCAAAPANIVIDLAEVTFAGATLPNFLAQLHENLKVDATILLCRPGTSIRRVLVETGMEQIATLRADLPDSDGSPL